MTYSGGYAIVLILHLLAAIFLIGPLGITGTLSARWVKQGDAAALRAGHRTMTVYSFASLTVPLLGLALVGIHPSGVPDWKLKQGWIGASIALYVVAVLVSLLVIAPAQKKAIAGIDAGDAPPPAEDEEPAKAPKHSLDLLQGRLQAASGVQMACWLVIVVLMVFKPGA